jgi:hypothetical protein
VLGERPPAELVDHAVAVVSGLPALAACDDARALAAEDVPPPTQAAQVAALEARLTAAKARTDAGLYAAAVVELEALVAEADTVAWAPLVVRATLAQGELALARLEPAEAPLTRAATLATERHLDREAAAAWQALAHAAAVARRADAVAAYAEIAAATARATGDAAVLRRQRIRQARVLVRLRRFADSERACRAVLAEVEADATADPRDRTAARDCLLEALVPQAKFDEAATLAEGLLADRRIHSGADHPAIADYTRVLGHLAYQRGDLDGARDRYRAAHELRLRVFGPRHVRTAESYGDLAGLEPEPDQRRRMLEEAIAVMAASDSPLAGLFERGLQAELAELAYRRDDPAAMRAHFDRAEILAAKHGPRSIDVAATLLAYGQYLTASDLEAGLAKLRPGGRDLRGAAQPTGADRARRPGAGAGLPRPRGRGGRGARAGDPRRQSHQHRAVQPGAPQVVDGAEPDGRRRRSGAGPGLRRGGSRRVRQARRSRSAPGRRHRPLAAQAPAVRSRT